MKSLKTVLIAIVLASLAACTSKQGGGEVRSVEAQEVNGMLRNDFAVLVDVREEDEVKGGMAAPATWIPTSKIEADDPAWKDFVAKLPKDKEIVFYCQKGGRAGKAAEKLAAQGYRVANMGSYENWTAAGLPTKAPTP